MLSVFFKSLRKTLFLWTFAFALIPTYFISSYLIEKFQTIQINEQIEKLELENFNVAQTVEFELQLLRAQLMQTSQDADVVLAAYAGVFGAKARKKLTQLTTQNPMLSAIMLIDKSGWIAEASPSKAELINIESLLEEINKLPKSDASEQHFYVRKIFSTQFSQELRTKASIKDDVYRGDQQSDHVFVYISSLIFTESESVNTGYLIGVVPVERIFDNWQSKLPRSQLMSLSLGNADLIENNISTVNNVIEVKAEMSVNKNVFIESSRALDDLEDKKPITIQAKVARDERDALMKVNNLIAEFKIFTVSILFIVLLLNAFIIHQILRPLNKLFQVVTAYANGNLKVEKPELFFKEINLIINVLSEMAYRIQQDQQELEHRVEQRTADLQLAYNELAQTNNQLKLMQRQLVESEKMSQLGLLVAGVAHEINTPVGVAVTASTALMDKIEQFELDFTQKQLTKSGLEMHLKHNKMCSDLIYNNLKRASELIQTFKEVAVDQSSESRRTFKLNAYLHEVIASLHPELKYYQVSVHITGDENFEFNNYPGAFGQIITNFVMNSLKHAFKKDEGHEITVHFDVDNDYIFLTYQDDGVGVAENELPKIFEPFYTTQRGEGGTGLGLNIIYNLVTQRLNGSITCESEVNQGIKFHIKIPKVLTES
mgnify:CR=1 FL=1